MCIRARVHFEEMEMRTDLNRTITRIAVSYTHLFNLGNAIGAYCGGLPLQAGLSYRYPALLGTFFALVGFILLVLFSRKYETARQHV